MTDHEPGALLSVAQAAAALGVSRQRVQQLVARGQLPAERLGAAGYVIRAADLALVRDRGRPGRPPQPKPTPASPAR